MQIARDVELKLGGDSAQRDTTFSTHRGSYYGSSGRVLSSVPISKDSGPLHGMGPSKQASNWASNASPFSQGSGRGPTVSVSASSPASSSSVAGPFDAQILTDDSWGTRREVLIICLTRNYWTEKPRGSASVVGTNSIPFINAPIVPCELCC